MSIAKLVIGLIAGAAATSAAAQSTDTSEVFEVTGNVPGLCSIGSLGTDDGIFALGTLIDLSTGRLRNDLSAPLKVLADAFCTSRSSITIEATPLESQNSSDAPEGFARAVHYTATASGWTDAAASFDTAATTNPAATQARATAFQGDISVAIDDFRTQGGDNLLLIADPSYLGAVTVTLTAAD